MNILELIESIATERNLSKEIVIKTIEEAIKEIAVNRYANEDLINVTVLPNGSFEVFIEQEVVEIKDYDDDFSAVSIEKALKRNVAAKIGDLVREILPLNLEKTEVESLLFSLRSKLNEIQKEIEYNAFIDKVGTLVTGYIKRVDVGETIISFTDGEGLLKKNEIMPNDYLKAGSYIKVYVKEVKKSLGRQIYLSRTHENLLRELLKQEVPEVKDGIVEVKAVSRMPGSIAKVAVFTQRTSVEPVKVCIGEYGSRIQAVSKELCGEKINVIKWTDDIKQFIANALSPGVVSKVVEKNNNRFDAVIDQEFFSKAMGRGGQNVILAKKLCKVNAIKLLTPAEEAQAYKEKIEKQLAILTSSLEIEEMMAHLLISEQLDSIEKIASVELEVITNMNGFNEEIAQVLQERAKEAIESEKNDMKAELEKIYKNDSLLEVELLTCAHIKVLIENNIFEKGDVALMEPKILESMFYHNDDLYLSFEQAHDIISQARGIKRSSE